MPASLRRRNDFEPNDPTQLRALIVDDDDNDRVLLAVLVRRLGFHVTMARDGAEALVLLGEGSRFDLVIIDCEMPRMNGLELIAEVRRHEYSADTYALMVTARTDVETKIAALRDGFDDFIVKSSMEIEIVAKLGTARRLITRQRRLDATVRELYGLATRDELTGLFNRRFFFEEAERILAQGISVGLVFFDLDDFKRINDTFGHLAGDRILRDIGSLFLLRTRHQDVTARYGGDEFVMLVMNLTIPEAEASAARLAGEIGALQWTFGTETFSIGATTGFACSQLLTEPTVGKLLSAGDQDLYKNKWLKRNPSLDPALYEYDPKQSHEVVEFVAREGRVKKGEG
jgi:diguanylate cyclase (GGDEF)-like protein